ncbi:cyclin domain protein [Metarhizium robertsii]|uniref:Cyclin domain protein n=1 Tax=Metarhizium robertsii TaxID=568076 RepID=A0A0A1UMX4_9HYPO|nr:cyclin domain protein [Metarhizium robertsii]
MAIVSILDDEGLDNLMNEPVSRALVDFLEFVTIRACGGLRLVPIMQDMESTSLRCFIERILYYSQIPVEVSLASSVYLRRLGSALGYGRSGSSSMPHRMFLGCLILTTKYLLDEPPTSSLWVQCLMLSCNNLFLTEEGVLALELDILKECKWRADIHEHDLLSELGLFMEFMKVAVDAVRIHGADSGSRVHSKDAGPQLRQMEAFIGRIRTTCQMGPCALCMDGPPRCREELFISSGLQRVSTTSSEDRPTL